MSNEDVLCNDGSLRVMRGYRSVSRTWAHLTVDDKKNDIHLSITCKDGCLVFECDAPMGLSMYQGRPVFEFRKAK